MLIELILRKNTWVIEMKMKIKIKIKMPAR